MSIFTRRHPRHALPAVKGAEEIPARPEATGAPDLDDITLTDKPLDVLRRPVTAPAGYSQDYDATGWADEAPLPRGDETLLLRVPGTDGRPGFDIPPGLPVTADPEDPLAVRTPGAAIPPALVPVLRTEPADPDMLRDVLDGLQALPAEPRHDEGEDGAPAAYLRAVVPGGATGVTQIQDALGHSPRFAGSGTLADGRAVAGMTLGTNEEGWFIVDALTPEWCADAIAALEEMQGFLEAAREQAEDGEAA